MVVKREAEKSLSIRMFPKYSVGIVTLPKDESIHIGEVTFVPIALHPIAFCCCCCFPLVKGSEACNGSSVGF